jgi:hypothetical protein
MELSTYPAPPLGRSEHHCPAVPLSHSLAARGHGMGRGPPDRDRDGPNPDRRIGPGARVPQRARGVAGRPGLIKYIITIAHAESPVSMHAYY